MLYFLLTADDQLEESTKGILEESKGGEDPTSTHEGGDDSITESMEQGDVEKEMSSEVDGASPGENSSQNNTAVKDDTSEVSSENTSVVDVEAKDSANPSGIVFKNIKLVTLSILQVLKVKT